MFCASAQAAKLTVSVPGLDRATRSPSKPAVSKFVYINVGKGKIVREKDGKYEMEFAITLSRSSAHEIFVTMKADGVTAKAGTEFVPQNKQIAFKPGQTVYYFDVPLVSPHTHSSEFFYLKELDPVGAQLGNGEGVGSIP